MPIIEQTYPGKPLAYIDLRELIATIILVKNRTNNYL